MLMSRGYELGTLSSQPDNPITLPPVPPSLPNLDQVHDFWDTSNRVQTSAKRETEIESRLAYSD